MQGKTSPQIAAAQEDEVYGALGALLGTLEVVATDDAHPVPTIQGERVSSALRLAHRLERHVDALLMLADETLEQRLRLINHPLRSVMEHALRGALRSHRHADLSLSLPELAEWADLRVKVDGSRVDRVLRGLAELLLSRLGEGGGLFVTMRLHGAAVTLELLGRVGHAPASGAAGDSALLLQRAGSRLFALHGGELRCELDRLQMLLTLPVSEAP